jgi:hypothetical protein
MILSVQATEAKIDKWNYIKLKRFFLYSKGNNEQSKENIYIMGENICNHPSDKGISKI